MAGFTKLEVLKTVDEIGIVPVFYHPDINVCKEVLTAVYNGGIRIFEFTNRGEGAHKVFEELVGWAKTALPGLILGIGSVIDAGTASMYIQLGANFVVAPIVNQEVAVTCNRRKIPWMPGCGSLTEISYAESLGADIVKIFPAQQVGGPDFIKAVKAPCPWVNIMPTGGVQPTEGNLKEWFLAGAHCVGLGSQLFVKNQQGKYDAEAITKAAALSVNAFKKWRK
ncbi:bifunctional 4-hydroxy-2-oxoglutarate aldolase/2-dehydro-3-deoxy-phosphogluconate aldolase [Flavobacterium sp. MK4S-17]|uniref:bifunctional 4-hydroxy-2-oxoglutarate aldolase/2-dehydro-3-deoxy-phosphogluconate aldolase n=1 Tax=Flavobacterium sp. MK4S-17 TaxID=2543737 RepID=UPI00135787A6|nr:bifunctional 4-hydroxy-2-oxoglutarate aldolase/2-dehydro-3-deoxy-phosphogluconate aldolase [Flavobacterium sp. MK4S-17]